MRGRSCADFSHSIPLDLRIRRAYSDCPDDAITSDTWSAVEKWLVNVTPRIFRVETGDSGHSWQFWHVQRTFPEDNFILFYFAYLCRCIIMLKIWIYKYSLQKLSSAVWNIQNSGTMLAVHLSLPPGKIRFYLIVWLMIDDWQWFVNVFCEEIKI